MSTRLMRRLFISSLSFAIIGLMFATASIEQAEAKSPLTIDPTVTEAQKLIASDGALDDGFGESVAIFGDTAIVGARLNNTGGLINPGSAYVFVKSGGTWIEQQKLTAFDGAANDRFGWSVAISGDTVIVGALADNNFGSAYVFVRNSGNWTLQQKLTAAGASFASNFGISVAIENDIAVIGAQNDNDGGVLLAGSAYVFERNSGVWAQQQKLTASDSATNDRFGRSVAISGGTAVIGAILDDDNGDTSGSAYIFVGNAGVWTQQQKLTANDGAAGDAFGWSVAISGDTVIVGAPHDDGQTGSAYAFVRNVDAWSQQQKLIASDRLYVDKFARSVAISGEIVLIGAYLDYVNGIRTGSAYIFRSNAAVWTEQQKLLASDGAANDHFGWSAALSGNTAVLGANGDESNSGAAYLFDLANDAALETNLAVDSATGQFNGSVDLSAALTETSGSSGVSGKSIDFSLNGDSVGSAVTDPTGTATLTGVSLAGIGVGSYPTGVSADFAGDDDYEASGGDNSLTVNKAGQTITFGGLPDADYGDIPFDVSATASSGLTVSFAAVGLCTVSGTSVTITGAGGCTITASQDGDVNYDAAGDVSRSFMINKAVLAVNPNDQTVIVGSPDPDFTFSYAGFVNGEDASVLDLAPDCGVPGTHTAPGSYTISCSGGVDNNYSFEYSTATLSVLYNFTGFFEPIDNANINVAKAGRAIPVKFSLSGNFGLNILAPGYPVSVQIPCSTEVVDETEIPTVTAGNSSLSYISGSDQYHYVWKTEKTWESTCRRLIVGLNDGTFHTADFKFK